MQVNATNYSVVTESVAKVALMHDEQNLKERR